MAPPHSGSGLHPRPLGRRELLGRAAAVALGVGAAHGLLPSAPVSAADTTQKRDLIILQAGDLSALDPHASTDSSDIRITFNVFDILVRRHPDGTLHPALATAWRRTGPTTWHLGVRRYVEFTPNPDQQLELRRFNFRLRRA
jgi:ABC-type transport system substrate-binding protein